MKSYLTKHKENTYDTNGKMLNQKLYFCTDEEMASRQEAALEILYDFNQTRPFTPTGDAIPTLDITFTPTLT